VISRDLSFHPAILMRPAIKGLLANSMLPTKASMVEPPAKSTSASRRMESDSFSIDILPEQAYMLHPFKGLF